MAKSVLELAVQTGQWNSGLKKAKDALNNFTEASGGLNKALQNDSEKMQKFVQMMGRTESTSRTAKGQMNDYKAVLEQLTMQYNRMTDAQKSSVGQDYLKSIEQIKQKYREVNDQVKALNDSLNGASSSGGGSFLSGIGSKMGGALQVFAGNMLTKAAGVGLGMVDEMAGMVQQGIELAKAGEGIRIAFERLGRGDILDGLRQATHGTVTDLELMKAAVKFNDFKLPLNELGTMLAFAQQKAKDTGQSVDYMVDSIVTGLGRKSLMILDNLGLSATEIREKMKETGDMTTAVGAIIREQMSKAGDYVETAADRAAQANVSLQNKMEELGRKFAPVEEASNQLWTSMKIAILDLVGGPIAKLLNSLTRAGRMKIMIDNLNAGGGGNQTHLERVIGALTHYSGDKKSLYNRQMSRYSELESGAWREANRLKRLRANPAQYIKDNDFGGRIDGTALLAELDRKIERAENKARAWQDIASQYSTAAKLILSPKDDGGGGDDDNKNKNKNHKNPLKEEKDDFEEIIGLIPQAEEAVKSLQQQIRLSEDVDELKFLNEELRQAQENLKELQSVGNTITPAVSDTRGLIERRRDNYVAGLAAQGEQYNDNILNSVLGIQHRYGLSDINMSSIQDAMENGGKVSDEELREILRQLNEKLSGTGMSVSADGNGNISDESDLDKIKKTIDKGNELYSKAVGGISNIVGGMQQLGVEIPEGLSQLLNALGGISTILTGISSILSFISVVTSAKPFALGGVVKAAGGVVAGRNFSGDAVPALLSSGEVVLNRAEVSTLASTLENGNRNESVDRQPYVTGEYIWLGVNNYLRSIGMGSIVTTKQ